MDPFEKNLSKFESTIRGEEMQDALKRCFNLLLSEIGQAQVKINEAEIKIKNMEDGRSN